MGFFRFIFLLITCVPSLLTSPHCSADELKSSRFSNLQKKKALIVVCVSLQGERARSLRGITSPWDGREAMWGGGGSGGGARAPPGETVTNVYIFWNMMAILLPLLY